MKEPFPVLKVLAVVIASVVVALVLGWFLDGPARCMLHDPTANCSAGALLPF